MKTPKFSLLTLGLLAVMVASACAPSAAPTSPPMQPVFEATNTPPAVATQPAAATPDSGAAPTVEAATQPPVPAATSRGDKLEASDPSQVSLTGRGLQLVEFFRFT